MTIKEALQSTTTELKDLKTVNLDTEILLCHLLKKDKVWLFLNLDKKLTPKQLNKYKNLVFQRQKGRPIAYITQHKEFFGLDFYIDESVLIPRPESELLVEETMNQITKLPNYKITILEIGTGSGAIAVSLVKNLQVTNYKLPVTFYASDISVNALKIAHNNAQKHKTKINFIRSDLFNNIPNIEFDLIIANLPYLDPQWIGDKLSYEPMNALNGGKDGLEVIKKFVSQSKKYLSKNGAIMLEIDPRQKEKIKKIAKIYYPNKKIILIKDLACLDRVVKIS